MLKESIACCEFAEFGGLFLGHCGLLSSISATFEPVVQCRLDHSAVFRDLVRRGFASEGDRDHVAAELHRERFRHTSILHLKAGLHRADVNQADVNQ